MAYAGNPNPLPDPPPIIAPLHFSDDHHPDTPDTQDLEKYAGASDASTVPVEYFGQVTFWEAYDYMVGADPNDVAPGIAQGCTDVSQGIMATIDTFWTGLMQASSGPDAWTGNALRAALTNVEDSFQALKDLSGTLSTLGVLARSFSSTIATTRNDIVSNAANYTNDLANHHSCEQTDQINWQYNGFAQAVMTQAYAPNIQKIQSICDNIPALKTAPTPQVGDLTGVSAGTGGGGVPGIGGGHGGAPAFGPKGAGLGPIGAGSGALGSIGGDGPLGALGSPGIADPASASATPQLATTEQAAANPAAGLDSAMQGLSGLTSPLQSALGQAMGGAQGAGNAGAPFGAKGLGKLPPEGALKGLKGGGSAGGGGGAGVRGPLTAKSASAPATTAGSTDGRTAAASVRAGLSNAQGATAAGAPGAGAPGGGHNAAAQGANHQPSKVLRSKKNGEELIGAAEAVVAVLGEPARTDAGKPGAA
jgi:hypothetical protein